MNRSLMIVGFILLILAAVFYFANIAGGIAIPLLIVGVVLMALSMLSGRI